MTTDISALNPNATYSYADYLIWKFEEQVEIIKGHLFRMSPAPKINHQKLSIKLLKQILIKFPCKNCQIFHAPFDVRLLDKKKSTDEKNIQTVVQPDICIVCDTSKLDDRGCLGAPDMIVEIVSKSTLKKDIRIKYDLYEENGVREYWIIFPNEEIIQVYDLIDGKFIDRDIDTDYDKQVKINVLGDFFIDVDELFAK